VGISVCRDTIEMESIDFTREAVSCEREYHTLSERFKAQVTLQQFISIKNPRWSKDEVTYWGSIVEGIKARATRWREAQSIPTPIRSRHFATVARCLRRQIIGVGVKVGNTLLRCTMIVRMRRCTGMQL
jgi:hypothetical protein